MNGRFQPTQIAQGLRESLIPFLSLAMAFDPRGEPSVRLFPISEKAYLRELAAI